MTAPSTLPPSVVAMLDTAARDALAHAIGRDAAIHYDRVRHDAAVAGPCMWPYQARVVCPNAADYEDPAGYCRDHAEIDSGGRP